MIRRISVIFLALILVLGSVSALAAEASPAFKQIFTDAGILRIDSIFFMLDSNAYAMNIDGGVHCLEFGYKDDVVASYVESVYLDYSDFSEADKLALDAQMRATYAPYESLEHVSIGYQMAPNYYMLKISADQIDKPEVLGTVVNAGLLTLDGNAQYISMSLTDAGLLAQGYTKR